MTIWPDTEQLAKHGPAKKSGSAALNAFRPWVWQHERFLVLAGTWLGVATAALWLHDRLALPWYYAPLCMSLAALLAWLVWLGSATLPHKGFGAANTVTTLRAGMVCLLAGPCVAESTSFDSGLLWSLAALILLILGLDGVDGYFARQRATVSPFGARYDMEVDAALILVLSLVALVLGKAGAWVLLIGLMRYVFLLAQWLAPRLRAELAPSMRRKVICVLQVASLGLMVTPVLVPPASGWLAAGCLGALVYSFGIDVFHLLRAGRTVV